MTAGIAWAWHASLDAETSDRNIPALVLTLLLAAGAAMVTGAGANNRPTRRVAFHRSLAMWTSERVFTSARLELTHETDSDNDSHYKLIVTDAAGSRTVHSQVHDSGEVVDLAVGSRPALVSRCDRRGNCRS